MRFIIFFILISTIIACTSAKNRVAESSNKTVAKTITSAKIPVDESLNADENEKFDELAISVCKCLGPVRKVKEKYSNTAADQSNFAMELKQATNAISGCMANFNAALVQNAKTHEKRAAVLNKIKIVCPDAAELMFPTR